MELQALTPGDSLPNGSIVLLNGPQGTAFQRFASDSLFHGTNGQTMTEDDLFLRGREPLLVLRAPDFKPLSQTHHGAFTLFVDPDTRTTVFVYDATHQTLTLSDGDVLKNLNVTAARHTIRNLGYDV